MYTRKHMSKKTQIIRMITAVALGLALAGSAVGVLAAGMGLDAGAMVVYGPALAASVLAGLCMLSGPAAVVCAVLLALGLAGILVMGPGGLNPLRAVVANLQGMDVDAQLLQRGGRVIAMLAAYIMGAAFTGMASRREFSPLAIFIFVGLAVVGFSLSDTISLGWVVPGTVAAVTLFALGSGIQRDSGAVRVLAPAVLAVVIALLLVPGERLTWQPLENAAERVRSMFEQYFNFSSERIAFSINEQGYDHAGMVGDEAVAMLGGPASPDPDPVMTVRADDNLLLRGTIRTAYTGYSWIDETVKNRYLYFDLTHSKVRDRIFGSAYDIDKGAFNTVAASVEFLSEGTSTLFVPERLDDFDMDLANAVYYNSAGEMFMAREVQPGDSYDLVALMPDHGEAMVDVVAYAMEERDDRYSQILADHTALPAGIDSRVYTLAVELTDGLINPYEKAAAIRDYLVSNFHYTLEPDYPPADRDFVSYFLLDSKEGYCSYFASAMAVMCRIAGLPARYVEGYLVRPDGAETVTLTGEDAHAWVEVYFNGVGWVSFDPSGGQHSAQQDEEDGHFDDGAEMEIPDDEPTPSPSPTPALHPEDDQNNSLDNFESDGTTPEPTPTLPPEAWNDDPFSDPFGEQPDAQDAPDSGRKTGWLWILLVILVILVLIFAAWLFVRARLRNADPVYLTARTRDARQAAMILYRANLTLLAHMGQGPLSGESPEAFARRVTSQVDNADFVAFVQAVALSAYAARPVDGQTVLAGRRAYAAFYAAMRPVEKLRFTLTRIFRGLGNFESIP
ncbi:MAG: transglutaminase domain-containing protein [Clostridiales bacterium]|nr:transglutaminase domain-containing protein [Clostridiales bacterium]